MNVFGVTHRGVVRQENQDKLRYSLMGGGELLAAVLCDGMGGAQAGSVASSIAADTFMSHAANSLDESSSPADMHMILTEAVNYANIKVYDRAFADFACMGMGSTLVGLLVNGKRASVINVGDSRAYLIGKRRITQITRDHSLVEDMVSRGKITRAQAQTHPQKNIITRAVGVEASVSSDLFDIKLSPGNRLLLCSDGLSNIVSAEEILMVSGNNPELEKTCGALLELALKRGAPDNVSVLLCER
jgi:protein phosphatase